MEVTETLRVGVMEMLNKRNNEITFLKKEMFRLKKELALLKEDTEEYYGYIKD